MLRIGVDVGGTNTDAAVMDGPGYLAHGGYEFDGRPLAPPDPAELRAIAQDIRRRGARAVAVCAVFSPIRADVEEQAAALLRQEYPELHISLSHAIGRLGLLERENAAALNACLSELAERTVRAMQRALGELGLRAPLFLFQNDGTLMSADFARRYPALTFASGPTNSMRGAAYLSALRDALVLDIGGTTTDVGEVFTATDAAVAAGGLELVDPQRLSAAERAVAPAVLELVRQRLAEAIDQMKTSAAPVPVVLVGGGSLLLQGELPGAAEVMRPPHAQVANAIGAAIAQVSGELDRVRSLDGLSRSQVLEQTWQAAAARATAAGADQASIELVEAEDVPLAYLPDLICIVAAADAEPITTELLRYGQRVAVIGGPCHPRLRTSEALEVVGPRAFGYDVEYRPLPAGEGPTPWT